LYPNANTGVRKVLRLSLKAIVVIAIFILSCFGFVLIAHEMVTEQENAFDFRVFDQLENITGKNLTAFMSLITWLGSAYVLFPAYCIIIAIFLLKKDHRSSLNIAAIALTGNAALYTFKDIFHRARPIDPVITKLADFSFPSGHSFASFTFFGLLIYITFKSNVSSLIKWLLSVLFVILSLLVALSRVYLHFHYASDVIAGCLLSAIWLLLSFWILGIIDRKHPPPKY
jgi:undecaprenyl-diphosphatase